MLPFQILQKHHIHINCTEIIFQNPDIFSLSHEIFRIVPDKCRLSGSQKTGDQIDFYHFVSFLFRQHVFLPQIHLSLPSIRSVMFLAT